MREYKWRPIDTPSIMFSAISTKKWGRTCRYAVVLKDHEPDAALLQQAAADLRNAFPGYYMKLKRGFFWNYLEQAESLPEIRREDDRPLHPIVLHKDDKPDFRLVYSGNRFALEWAHHLTDGFGAQTYFLSLVQRYMILAGLIEEGSLENVRYWNMPATEEEQEDSFLKYGNNDGPKAVSENMDVHHYAPDFEKGALYLTYFYLSSACVKERAKALQLTITEYLTAVNMLAIIKATDKSIDKPICVDIPVNLRRFFPSATLRNFVYQVSTVLQTNGRRDWTLEEIAGQIRGQVQGHLTTENLQSILKKLTGLAVNPVVRIVPNSIKLPVLRVLQKRSHANQTTIITNLGQVQIPAAMAPHIERLELVNGDTSGYGLPSTCAVIGFNNELVLCFSSSNSDNSVLREYARILTQEGLAVQMECTYAKKHTHTSESKRFVCPDCGAAMPSAYAGCPLCDKNAVLPSAKPGAYAEMKTQNGKTDKKGRLSAFFHL